MGVLKGGDGPCSAARGLVQSVGRPTGHEFLLAALVNQRSVQGYERFLASSGNFDIINLS